MLDPAQEADLREYIARLISVVEAATDATEDDIDDHCADIAAVVHDELAGVMRRRNEAATHRIMPPELLANVFSWLEPLDLILVACVSSAWRNIALSFPQLWNDIEFKIYFENDLSVFQLLVARAQDQPLDLRLELSWDIDYEKLHNIIFDNNSSIRFLSVNDSLELRDFQTNRRGAECLQYLYLTNVFTAAPVSQPFINLSTLIATNQGADMSDLFSMCPNLVTLEIHGELEMSLLPRSPFPSSLERFYLLLSKDASDYLVQLIQHPIRTLRFNTMQYMMLKERNLHTLFNVEDLNLCTSYNDNHMCNSVQVVYQAILHDEFDLIAFIGLLASGLRRLILPVMTFFESNIDLELPLLEHLTLRGYFGQLFRRHGRPDTTFTVPNLRTLVLQNESLYNEMHIFPEAWARRIRPVDLRIHELVLHNIFSKHDEGVPEGLRSIAEDVSVVCGY